MNTSVQSQGPVGVGGWLTFLIVIMAVVGPLLGLGRTNSEILALEIQYPDIVNFDWWSSYKTAVWLGTIIISAVGIWGGYSLGTIKTSVAVSRAKIALWVIYPGAVVVLHMMVPAMYLPKGGGMAAMGIGSLLASLFWLAVWIAYLNKSKRVNNTYFTGSAELVTPIGGFGASNDHAVGGYAVPASSLPSQVTYKTSEPARTRLEAMEQDWQRHFDETTVEKTFSKQSPDFDENAIYAQIANELDTKSEDKGLWTRLFADSDGDEKKTKVLYIKHRAAQLTAAEKSRIDALSIQAREAAKTKEQQEAKQRAQHEIMEKKVRETAELFGVTPDVAAAALRHGIVKDGARFRYGEFFYDRIADAIAYADIDAGRGSKPLWAPKPQPQVNQQHVEEKSLALDTRFTLADVAEKARMEGVSTEDAESMLRFNIKKEGGRYVYQTYRYDKLADAIIYAKCDVGRVAK